MLPALPPIAEIHPLAAEEFEHHLRRLSLRDRNERFGHAVSVSFLSKYAFEACAASAAFAGCAIDGALRGIGELRIAAPLSSRIAEAAFSIEAPWQNNGLGTALMANVIDMARRRGIASIKINCRSDNWRMQRIAQRFGGTLAYAYGECSTVLSIAS